MKPLAHWAIHQRTKIRIVGRQGATMHGELIGSDGVARPFVYDQELRRLTIDDAAGQRVILLDDYGFEIHQP